MLRVNFPGAVFHLFARSFEGKSIFSDPAITTYTESALIHLWRIRKWSIYAYSMLGDAFHLVFQAPDNDIPDGMKQILGSVAGYYNRRNNRRGPVFAGRYKSILVEEGPALLDTVRFVHACPVLLNKCSMEELPHYQPASFAKGWHRETSNHLMHDKILDLYGLKNTKSGWNEYHQKLAQSDEADPAKKDWAFRRYCRGWFIGSPQTKIRLARKLNGLDPSAIWTGSDHHELNEVKWEQIVTDEMTRRGIKPEQIDRDAKGASWKAEIAFKLRTETSANNIWIADRLGMGHPNRVSMLLKEAKSRPSV